MVQYSNKDIDLKKCTPTQLLKLSNDCKAVHEKLKKEIVDLTHQVDEIEKVINEKIEALNEIENEYVSIMEEMSER